MMQTLALKLDPEPYDFDAHTIDQMATVIARHLQQKHSCSIEDMLAENFSPDDVSRYWGEANKLAEKKRPRPSWW